MKKTTFLLYSAFILLFTQCDTNDDGFFQNVYMRADNLVSIQTQPSYAVNDYLYITADFSRYLPDLNPANSAPFIDIYKTTGGATQFAFSYVIERKVSPTEWQPVIVPNNQLNVIKGTADSSIYVYGICQYNAADESYEYNVGFPLLSAGEYRLSFGYNSTESNVVELRSISSPKDLILNINSFISLGGSFYTFTVN